MQASYEQQLDESDRQYWEIADQADSERAYAAAICEQVQQRHVQKMTEAISTWKSMKVELEEELQSLNDQLKQRDEMITMGKAKLDYMQSMANEANEAAATARKECEVATTKNTKLTRELFLLRRVSEWMISKCQWLYIGAGWRWRSKWNGRNSTERRVCIPYSNERRTGQTN